MSFINKVLNALVTIGLVGYFCLAITNFWLLLPYLIIFTVVALPTIFTNDSKYFSKLIDYVYLLISKLLSLIFRKIEIDRDSVKWGLFWGGVFYVIIIFKLLGGIASFEKCLNNNGISHISYCYSKYEWREFSANDDK